MQLGIRSLYALLTDLSLDICHLMFNNVFRNFQLSISVC